jgi:hypothetical protein
VTIPSTGSRAAQAQVPSAVPISSSQLTTTNAPTYRVRLRPHSKNPARQANQNAPSTSWRGANSPHSAQPPPVPATAQVSGTR